MSYLKLIANAVWAGLYGSILITLLLFFLNEDLAVSGGFIERFVLLLVAVGLVYVPLLALLFPSLFVCVRFFAARRLGLGWFTFKAVVWFGTATLGALCCVFYQNLRWAVSLQSPPARDALRISFFVMTACWILATAAVVVAQMRPESQGRSGAPGATWRSAAAGILLVPPVVMTILLVMLPEPVGNAADSPAAAIPAGEIDSRWRALVIIGLQSASMDDILPLVAARELPVFERLLKEGASARLDTITPCASRAAWVSLATGLPPWATGVKDSSVYSLAVPPGLPAAPDLGALPRSLGMEMLARVGYIRSSHGAASAQRGRPFWVRLRDAGLAVGAIQWPGADATPADSAALRADDPRISSRLEKILGAASGAEAPPVSSPLMTVLRGAIREDFAVRDAALAARRRQPALTTGVFAVLFPGLGSVSRYFLRYQRAAEFGDVTSQESAWFGKVIARYYVFLDELIAEQAELAGPGAAVMVVSAHGVEPVSAWERLVQQILPGEEEVEPVPSGTWRRGPDGLLMILGAGIASGAKIEDASILDVLPTMLYLLGVPIERDFKGTLLRRFFTREFLESHPVQLVPGRQVSLPRH